MILVVPLELKVRVTSEPESLRMKFQPPIVDVSKTICGISFTRVHCL